MTCMTSAIRHSSPLHAFHFCDIFNASTMGPMAHRSGKLKRAKTSENDSSSGGLVTNSPISYEFSYKKKLEARNAFTTCSQIIIAAPNGIVSSMRKVAMSFQQIRRVTWLFCFRDRLQLPP